MKTPIRRTLKTLAAVAASTGMIAMAATAASAHVKVDPDSTGANGYSHLTFNVPNESPTAKTTKLEVKLPTETPFTSVSVKPVEGWTAQVITSDLPKPVTVSGTTVTKAPTSVIWTADSTHQIGQNEYQSFSLSVGKLPQAGTTVILPAAQTYTDGTVVNWDEKTVDGQPEPKHPAPAFTLGPFFLRATVEPKLGPLATAYVLILVVLGPIASRYTEPLARRLFKRGSPALTKPAAEELDRQPQA